MSEKKILFLDVDGTLIDYEAKLPLSAEKAVNMAKMMNVDVLGVIENYSYLLCPHCGEKISVFGESHIKEISEEKNIDLLGQLPMNPEIAKLMDQGKIENIENTDQLNKVLDVIDRL